MKLKKTLTKDQFGELNENIQALYQESADNAEEYTLQFAVDNSDEEEAAKARIKEFRDNNITITKENENLKKEFAALQKKFENVDDEKLEMIAKVEEQKMVDAGNIDEAVQKRTKRLEEDFNAQTAALEERAKNAERKALDHWGRIQQIAVDDAALKAIAPVATIRKHAQADVLGRARSVWKLDDESEKLMAFDLDGQPAYGKDGTQHLTKEEWARQLVADAPHLFEPNSGGGAGGSNDTANEGFNPKAIDSSDKASFLNNLEDIASGKKSAVLKPS